MLAREEGVEIDTEEDKVEDESSETSEYYLEGDEEALKEEHRYNAMRKYYPMPLDIVLKLKEEEGK